MDTERIQELCDIIIDAAELVKRLSSDPQDMDEYTEALSCLWADCKDYITYFEKDC